jgi:hypothetical protein
MIGEHDVEERAIVGCDASTSSVISRSAARCTRALRINSSSSFLVEDFSGSRSIRGFNQPAEYSDDRMPGTGGRPSHGQRPFPNIVYRP